MKVLIVNNMAPFVWGGAEELAVHLQKQIEVFGYQSEILRLPFQWEPAKTIISQMLYVRGLELTNVDRVIALKFPAYLIRHPHKTLWLLHQYRQAYDLYDVGETNLVREEGQNLKQVIHQADNQAFAEAQKIFVNSTVTQRRLKHYNGFDSQVLLPPLNDIERFSGGEYGDYIFAGGRVNSMKRQHLLVEALSEADPRVRLVIAGPPDKESDRIQLENLVAQYGLTDRVKLDLRFLPREDYAAYVNGARCVAYLPYDEDSLGYVTMEAATAKKAILTTSDSGGILGLAKDGATGWITEPNAIDLAKAMSTVFQDRAQAELFGNNAKAKWEEFDVNWESTVKALVS